MFISKQKYYFFLLILLFPFSVKAAWSEPTQAPTGGNAAVPIYSEGSGQTLNGTLHVDPTATNPTSLQGSGSTNGIQGNSVGNGLFGNLTANGAAGGRSVYGLAVDAADYGLYASGGLGLGVASGDIWFLQQDQGIAWPRESDGASLYGVYVTNTGELQVRGHGAGINFMDQNTASRLTVSEAGAVNVVNGPLTVGGTAVCLSNGANCPPPPPPPPGSSLWLPNGNDIYPNFSGDVKLNHGLFFNGDTAPQAVIDFDPYQGNLNNYFLIRSGVSATYGERNHFRIDRNNDIYLGGNTYFGNQDVTSLSPINYGLAIKSGDIYIQNNKSIRLDDVLNNTTVLIGNYLGGGAGFDYGTNKTASLAVEGDVKGNQLCIKEDCKNSWAGIVQGGGGAYWTLSGNDLFPNNNNYNVGIGNSAPGAYKLNVTGDANATRLCIGGDCRPAWPDASGSTGWNDVGATVQLVNSADAVNVGQILNSADPSNFYINGQGNVQIRLDTDGGGSYQFKIVNDQNNTIFSVDEFGNISNATNIKVSGIGSTFNGAVSSVPLAVKTGTNGLRVECSLVGCGNNLDLEVKSVAYGAIKTSDGSGVGTALILQPNPFAGINGGKVGIGTTAPNGLLHLKTNTGNAEFDIQSAGSPYWAIYQDDTTDELRFWNNNITNNKNALTFNATSGDVVVNNALGVGTVPSWRLHVSDLANQYAAQIDGNVIITNNKSLCLDGDCKNDWGPNTATQQRVRVPNPPDGSDINCPAGYVVTGLQNTSPETYLICSKMW